MASVLEPEVQFAQKLASNEKPTRNKAVKKLRKYISARSRRETGGFSEEELLKLWKGLFYCLWMQDKPLLQEELSTQITTLIHHFHSYDQQLLFLRTFLSTVKREWTGIDRLRMDKFFQLARFMFRQSFEVLQRIDWDQSCVGSFLGLLSSELLQGGAPPVGLQMHVLDLYLRELAVVGAQQLTADQNLTFIEPFCKTAAKTKDRCLFRAICNSIFSLIIDQAPFAIEELLKEVDQGSDQDQDSGQASDQDEPEEEQVQLKTKRNAAQKTKTTKQMNGTKTHSDQDDEEDDEDEDEDDLLDSDSEQMYDEDMGPVLQFDYGAVADKLLELSSRWNTPSRNRQRLYKIVKVLRDLSQGSFPQDAYPEEVSTDEDDDDFGSRKRMKRKHGEEEEEEPELKKTKGKKQSIKKSSVEPNTDVSCEEAQKKKRKKKKKKKKPQNQTDPVAEAPAETKSETEVQSEPWTAAVPSDEATSLNEERERITAADEDLGEENQATKKKKKNKKNSARTLVQTIDQNDKKGLTPGIEATPETEVQSAPWTAPVPDPEPEKMEEATSLKEEGERMTEDQKSKTVDSVEPLCGTVEEKNSLNDEQQAGNKEEDIPTAQSKPKKKKKSVMAPSAETDLVTDTLKTTPLESTLEDESKTQTEAEDAAANLAPKKKKIKKSKAASREQPSEDQSSEEAGETPQMEQKKKKKKKTNALEDVVDILDLLAQETDVTAGKKNKGTQPAEETVNNIQKKKKKKRMSGPALGEDTQTIPQKKKKKKIPVEFEYEADEIQTETSQEIQHKAPVRPSQKQKKKSSEAGFVSFQSRASPPTPLFCRARGPSTPLSVYTKRVTPKSDSKKVTFGLKNNKTAEFRKSDRSLLLSPDGSSRVPFDPEQKPKCGVLKSTPVRREKKTPGKKIGVRARPTAADFF